MLCGGNFGMQLQPHVIGLQRIFYTVNPVQVSGGGEQNVWGEGGRERGREKGREGKFRGAGPPLPMFFPRTAPGNRHLLLNS